MTLRENFSKFKQKVVDVVIGKPSIESGITSFEPTPIIIPNPLLQQLRLQRGPGILLSNRGILYQPADVGQVVPLHMEILDVCARTLDGSGRQIVFGNNLINGNGLIYFAITSANTFPQAISTANKELAKTGQKPIPNLINNNQIC